MIKKLVQIKMTESLKNEVKEVCESDSKTITGYIIDLILDDFKKRGLRNGTDKKIRTKSH